MKDKFGVDLNLVLDPLKLEASHDQSKGKFHFGVSHIRLGYTFTVQQLEDALAKNP